MTPSQAPPPNLAPWARDALFLLQYLHLQSEHSNNCASEIVVQPREVHLEVFWVRILRVLRVQSEYFSRERKPGIPLVIFSTRRKGSFSMKGRPLRKQNRPPHRFLRKENVSLGWDLWTSQGGEYFLSPFYYSLVRFKIAQLLSVCYE